MLKSYLLFCSLLYSTLWAQQPTTIVDKEIAELTPTILNTYKQLHANPELSRDEKSTSALLQYEMKKLGFEIIDSLGYYSFAAVLKNGPGPAILYRTDMDGLPVLEKTNLSFASTVSRIREGEKFPAMHACGHDIHMSSWLGLAQIMTRMKTKWSGTLIMMAQSAEETGQGAKNALKALNFGKIPRPDMQLAVHAHASLRAGEAGFCDGYAMASVDMMTVTIHGKGGHGAAPEKCIDPIVIAAQFINEVQTIVSRNLSSNDPAVITVGSIQGGTAHNIIPDKVVLKLTIRSFNEEARRLIIERIKTIGDHLSQAAGMDKNHLPEYDLGDMSIPSLYNDIALGTRLRAIIAKEMGDSSVQFVKPVMLGEDFSVYSKRHEIPSYLIWVGTQSEERVMMARTGEITLPGLHTASFEPYYEKTVPAIIKMMSLSLLKLFKGI